MEFLFSNLNPLQTVLKNSFWLFTGQIISKLLKFILVVFIARILEPTSWGSFQYVFSITSILFIFSSFGIDYLLVRDYFKNEKEFLNKYLPTAISLRIALLFLSVIAGFIVSFVVETPSFKLMMFALLFFITFDNFKDFLTSFFQIEQRMEKIFLITFLEQLSIFGLGLIAVLVFENIVFLALAYTISALTSLILTTMLLPKNILTIPLKTNFSVIKYYFNNGLPLTLFGILTTIMFSSDQILLGKLKSVELTGYYSIATKVISAINLLPSAIIASLLPLLAQKYNQESFKTFLKKVILKFALLSLTLVFLTILASFFVTLIFGKQYLPSIKPLRLLSLTFLSIPLIMLFDNILFLIHKQWQNFFLTSFATILNIILNLLLIPKYEMTGAALATIFSQAFNLFLTSLLILYYLFPIKNFLRKQELRWK